MENGEGRRRRDLEDRLRSLVKQTAVIEPMYGGFEITIRNPEDFPWSQVMNALMAVGQDVWVRRQRGLLVIDTKPPSV